MRLNVIDQSDGNFNGTGGDDLIIGTEGADIIRAGGGNDIIRGNGGGSDFVSTGGGNDTIVVAGDEGAFIVANDFEPGSDVLDFSELDVDAGDVDIVDVSGDPNSVGLTEIRVDGAETIVLQTVAADELDINRDFNFGNNGNNAVADNDNGGQAQVGDNDGLNVIDENDAVGNGQVLNGTNGDDLFVGRSAEDTQADAGFGIVGEEFSGAGGNDVFQGNGGNDSFFLNGGDNSFFGPGNDRVIAAADDGFQSQVFAFEAGAGAGDVIDFSSFNANGIEDLTIEEGNGGTLVSAEGSQTLNLRGVDIDDLNEDDFVFADEDAAVA